MAKGTGDHDHPIIFILALLAFLGVLSNNKDIAALERSVDRLQQETAR